MVTNLLRERGERYYTKGLFLTHYILLPGAALLGTILLIALLGWGSKGFLACLLIGSRSDYTYVNFLMILAYFAILIGSIGFSLCFKGLHLLGLAQIAENTAPAKSGDTLPKL